MKPLLLFFFVFFVGNCCIFGQPKKLPNIILIVADDLGYSDLSSYGNTAIHTPNIDALGKEGVRFTQAYVTAPICSPSRMSIFTGRYQQRFGCEFMPYDRLHPSVRKNIEKGIFSLHKKTEDITSLKPNLLLNRSEYITDLPATEITMAQLLKKQGYATALVGKWNLNTSRGKFPDQRGYDYAYYFDGALTRYVDDPVDTSKYINWHLPWAFSEFAAWAPRYGSTAIIEGRKVVKDTGYLTFSFADKSIDFIEKNKDHPFFLTLTFNAPHDPFQVPKDYFDRIKGVTDSTKRVYYGMIEALDDAVGSVMTKLTKEGLLENTIIFFISDNGGATYTRATDNAPLRGGKCTHFDGGLLVPFFIRYPVAIKPSQVYTNTVSSLDIFSTIAAISGATLSADRTYDGVNILPYLSSDALLPHKSFYWRNGYSKAIRIGDWKLYVNEKNNVKYLFNIALDREEKHDLSSSRSDKLKELNEVLQQWEKNNTIKPLWPSGAGVLINVNGKRFHFPT